MRLVERLKSFVGGLFKKASASSTKIATGIRMALSQGMPGAWSSDHREEAQHFTGWNYIAIDALAIQAQQADVNVYDDGSQPGEAALKRAFRKTRRYESIRKGAYQEHGKDDKPVDPDHPLVRLLKRPNPTQSGASFRYEQIIQIRTTGSCYIWNVPNGAGKTVERYVIPTAMLEPVPPQQGLPKGGYRISTSMARFSFMYDAQGFSEAGGIWPVLGGIIPTEQMQVVRKAHPIWKDDGYSPLSAGSLQSDVMEQMEKARWAGLKNGGAPSMLISPPDGWNGDQTELEMVEDRLNEKLAGAENNRKISVTTFKSAEVLSFNGREMDFANTYPQARDAVLALHGTPLIAAGVMGERGSYAALYATLTGWVLLRVQPELDVIAEEDTEQLAPQFGNGLTVEYKAMQFNDPDVLEKQLQTEIQGGGIREVDEVRKLRGLPPLGGEEGKRIFGKKEVPPALDPNGDPVVPGANAGAQGDDEGDKPAGPAQKDNPDDESTGISAGVKKPKVNGKRNGHGHRNRLNGHWHPAATAALEGALSSVETPDEVKELLKSVYP